MTSSAPGRRSAASVAMLLMVLSATVIPMSSTGAAAAEIPHENYDLVGSDLDTLVALLNSSIRSSEGSLRASINESLGESRQYLDRVRAVMVPAKGVLGDLQDVAGSYDHLSELLPPFIGLYDAMEVFYNQEAELLDARSDIYASSAKTNLTDDEVLAALEAINRFNSLIDRMNGTIDGMLVHAHAIDALVVEGRAAFVPNELVELIGQLRDMLERMRTDVERAIEDDVPWDEDVSFLTLWVRDTSLYLGESIVGGGYLFLQGVFVSDRAVEVLLDNEQLVSAATGSGGQYGFSHEIPLDASWLGGHTVVAMAEAAGGSIESDPVLITVSMIPTRLSLSADMTAMSGDETVTFTAKLTDVKGEPLPGMECVLTLDGDEAPFVTDDDGMGAWARAGAELGFGAHEASASFAGLLPYAPSSSANVTVVVDIPTEVELRLFSERLAPGYKVLGEGWLTSNGSDPMPMRDINLHVDGELVTVVRTQADGKFAFSIDTDDIAKGTHELKAAFVPPDALYRYSEAVASFVIIEYTYSKYPFFPWIPGWDFGGLAEQIPYLLFGENAYYTWLMIILVIGVVIKALQVRKARRAGGPRRRLSPATAGEEPADAGPTEPALGAPELAPDWLPGPNEKVVWHYNRLISFLSGRRRIGIRDDMTHWEVARLLRSLGYPQNTTDSVTMLFEKAFYSGASMSEADVIMMGSSAHAMKRMGGGRPAG